MKYKRNHIRNIFSDTFYVWKDEVKNIFTDSGVLVLFFIAPLLYPLLYGFIYNNEQLREVPVSVVDNSQSSLSREVIRRLDATPDVLVYARCADLSEAKQMQRKGITHGTIVIPEDFSKNINIGKQTALVIYGDVSSFLYYKTVALACSQVALQTGGEIQVKRMVAKGTAVKNATVSAQPFKPVHHVLYNPGGYPSFLVPVVLILIIQQTLLMGIGMLAGTARERNEKGYLIPNDTHFLGTWRVVNGKALAYFLYYVLVMLYLLMVVPRMFQLPHLVHAWQLLLFCIPYLLSCIFLSMGISVFFHNRENPLVFFIALSMPLLFLTGLPWPKESMPIVWKFFGGLLPSTYGAEGFVRLSSMGASLHDVRHEYFMLWILTGLYFFCTYLSYKWIILKETKDCILSASQD